MRILAILLVQLFAFNAYADDYMDYSTRMFNFSDEVRSNESEEKFYTRDFCFRTCGVVIYSYRECRKFAQTIEEKTSCISDNEKACLMECKNIKLDETGLKQRVLERAQQAQENK